MAKRTAQAKARTTPSVPFDQPLPHRMVIRSDLHAARDLEEEVLRHAEAAGFSRECAFALRLSLEEALVNAHRHGNCCDPTKRIIVSYDITPARAIVRVRDEGCGFNPCQVPDPTHPDRISLPSGRGIMLMRSYLDEVVYNAAGNEVQLIKERR